MNIPRRPCMIPFLFGLVRWRWLGVHSRLFHRDARLRSALVNYVLRKKLLS